MIYIDPANYIRQIQEGEELNDTNLESKYIFRRSIARDANAKSETRSRDSFLPSLSLSLVFHLDRHSSRSILGKPGDFSPPSCENAKPPPVSRGFFLPSFLPLERERERERAAVFRRWNFIFIRVLRVRTRNGCDDIANTRRFSGESRGLDETKLEGGERKTERRLPFVSGFPSFGFRSFVRSSPRETRESPFSFSFPNFSQFFFISTRFLRRVKKTSSEIDDPSRFS